jgi:hypothetical protein
MLPDCAERLLWITPPVSHVRALQPRCEHRHVAGWVEGGEMDIRHMGITLDLLLPSNGYAFQLRPTAARGS